MSFARLTCSHLFHHYQKHQKQHQPTAAAAEAVSGKQKKIHNREQAYGINECCSRGETNINKIEQKTK